MAFCVNTHSQEFKDTAKRLGVSEFELGQIAYKYGNQSETYGQFPSDEYVKEQLNGVPNYNASEAQAELWKLRYSEPLVFDSFSQLQQARTEALQYFGAESVRYFKNADGKYELRVGEQGVDSANEVFLQKASRERQRNLETLRTFYSSVVSGIVNERRALAEQKRTEYRDIVFRRDPMDVSGRLQQAEAQSELDAFLNRYGSIAEAYLYTLPNGNIKLVVKPLSKEVLQNKALSLLNKMSDADLASEVQRISQEYEVDEDTLFYINPKKVEEIKAQIAKKNRFFNKETIDESVRFLEELDNNQEDNLFVQTAIRWLKNGTVSFPRDNEKVRQIFDSARKYGIDIQSSKSPIDLQIKILEKQVKEIEAGRRINTSKYKELSYDRTIVTEDGKEIVIYNVEDSEDGQRAVCDILAVASPKVDGRPASSPWCLSTFNYNKDTRTAIPTESARHFWEHYNKGKRQIAFVDGRPVAFNSSSEAIEESWWDFNDTKAYDDVTKIDFESPTKLYENNAKEEKYFTVESGIYTTRIVGNRVESVAAKISDNISVEQGQNYFDHTPIFQLSFDGNSIYIDNGVISGSFELIPHTGRKYGVIVDYNSNGLLDAWISFNRYVGWYSSNVMRDLNNEITSILRGTSLAKRQRELINKYFGIDSNFDINDLRKLETVNTFIDEYRRVAGDVVQEVKKDIDAAIQKVEKAQEDKLRAKPKEETPKRNKIRKQLESVAEDEILTDSWAPVQNQSEYSASNAQEYAEYDNEDDASYAAAHGEAELSKIEKLTGIRYKIKELLQALNFGKEKSYAAAYNERVLKPLNKQLAERLHSLLRGWNFEVIEASLKETFGDDVLGALDVLEKVVYLSNGGDRNQITDAEEFSHAFVKLMGATYRKLENRNNHPENRLYSELRDIIETTDLFRQTLEQYGTTKEYQYANGTPNRAKIAEEALGKALAVALNERYEAKNEAEKSFLNKVIQWFKDALLWFKGFVNKNGRLEKELNNIADSILRGDESLYGKYLPKAPINQELVDFEGTVERDAQEGGHGMGIIRFMNSIGGILTGSMSYRAQGDVYRTEQDSLHDLDFTFNAASFYSRNQQLKNPLTIRTVDNAEIVRLVQEYEPIQNIMQHENMHFLQAFPATKFDGKNEIIVTFMRTENSELAERFRGMAGSYAKRLENFTEQERQQIYLIDCFLTQGPIQFVRQNGVVMANYKESFKAKLKMGRAKDLIDYRQWRPNYITVRGGDLMFQKNTAPKTAEITQKDIETAKSLKRNKIEHLEGQVSWLEDRVRYNRATVEQRAELESVRRELTEEQSLYDGLESGASEVYINEYNVPQIRRVVSQDFEQSSFVQNAEFYSGAAVGSDRAWGTEARKLGIKVRDYTRADWAGLSQEWKNRLSAEYESVARDLGRNVIPLGGRGDIEVRRDMMQADKADAIFAIGRPVKPGERGAKYINRSNHEVVDGGTGYAVQRGIQRGIPVYLYDRIAKQWKMWDANTGSFVATEEPVLTPHAAVIGTRGDYYADRQEYDITEEEKGVIRSVLQKTLNQQQTPQQQGPINIWAGSNENADLSNFAFRPFTLPMGFRLPNGTVANIPWKIASVEAAFQALKANYTKAGTLEEETENNKIRESILGNTRLSALEHGRRVKTLGRNFRNFDSASWERDKAAIMKTFIKESFKQNPQALQRLLNTGDAVLTHNQETSIWKTEFPRILMEVRSELRSEQNAQPTQTTEQESLWAPPSVEREFRENQKSITTKINNLVSSGDITVTEVHEEANKLMDWLSDQLTQYQDNPELIWSKYKKDLTKEEVAAKVKTLSRLELLQYIGIQNIIDIYKAEVISPNAGNAEIFASLKRKDRKKFKLVGENLSGLLQYGYSRFLAREGFGIKLSDVEGETFEVVEGKLPTEQENPDDFNSINTDDVDRNAEELGNQQDHWQIESATRDIMANASVKVKQAIADCFVLADNGKKNEDGTPNYDNVKDVLNRNERVVPINAVRSIVKWTQGAQTLSAMTERLAAKEKANPWISQIVKRLQDQSGNESDFQSQFFNTFEKHFQAYSIVKRNADGTYYTMTVNVNPALAQAMDAIQIQYRTGGFALVNETGKVNSDNLEQLRALVDTLEGMGDLTSANRTDASEVISNILYTLGLPQPVDAVSRALNNQVKNKVFVNAKNVIERLDKAIKDGVKEYNPFEYGSDYSIGGFIRAAIRPFTDVLEETMVSSVFDSGKMYQSYITPSWTTKLFQKMQAPDRQFKEFLLSEFGGSEWYIDPSANLLEDVDPAAFDGMSDEERKAAELDAKIAYIEAHPSVFRTPWLATLVTMTPEQRQEAFQHKVQLNFDKQNYMRGMNDLSYVMSVFTEYFAESNKSEKGVRFANYRFPMISNKPSNEFVKFVRYSLDYGLDERGISDDILRGFVRIFHQELSRIQTVEMRNLKEGDRGYIANFDYGKEKDGRGTGKGLEFNFLDYLNDYLYGSKKGEELGLLIDRKLHADAKNALSSEEESRLNQLVRDEVANHLSDLADRLVQQYKENGLFEALKNIEGVGKTDFDVEHAIREFAWNDNFSQANLLELLVTDKAFYKNEEDLQKRLAQVHSPGIRGNWEATDFDGKPVSDGKVRVVKLADYIAKGLQESIIDNLEVVFNKRIESANEDEKQALMDLKDNILDAYRKINVVDGQAFVSPTAYRKKAIAFGEWTREDETVYNELMAGKFNLASLQRVFNPRKPFTYGKVSKSVDAGLGTPIKTLRYGVQYKNSEYLLIMADAIMRGNQQVLERTEEGGVRETNYGRPNLLGAIFDLMEESAKTNPTKGIDFVVFESGVKTGLTGAIDIGKFIDDPQGREKAFTELWNSTFLADGNYNEDFVDVLDAEDYTTQQTVPEHFMHGELQWGSQVRVIMPSDLERFYNGQEVVFEYEDPATGQTIRSSSEEIKKLWEQNTANLIELGAKELEKELGLDANMSLADRNILISKILQREILSNPRYGVDLLLACSVDESGNFRIPLGDPIQSKRVEQLLNSIIKNRINKQKVEGGTLVEVTNFGTSKRLNIRFKDKNNSNVLLDTRAEYLAKGHTEEEYKQYVKDNQGGIAYYECYAPAWFRTIYQKFTDREGNVDIEAIKMLDPNLLKMFGYRIPTEDKYSTAPYKIVGFLPQEAGDGFMQPWETTVIDGSDFDVDKKNLMRMALKIKSNLLSKKEFFEQEGLTEDSEENNTKFAKYRGKMVSARSILEKIGDAGEISLTEDEIREAQWYEKSRYRRDRKALKDERNVRNEQAEEAFRRRHTEWGLDELDAAIKELEGREDLTGKDEERLAEYTADYEKKYDKLTKSIDGIRANNERWYQEEVEKRRERFTKGLERAVKIAQEKKKTAIVQSILKEDSGVFRNSATVPENQRALFLAVKKAYLSTLFKVEKPKAGTKDYYNNMMFNMQWAIATHEATADKMLNPGNFDPQKRMGYMVAANRLGYSWDELQGKSIDDLKKLVFTTKNLMDFDVQTQFYRQNAVAGQILGIFAVAKSAHAMFAGLGYGINLSRRFSIDGMEFSGTMPYDELYDRTGTTLIGKGLGSLVGASADAVKDPVLNFMNINKETINVLNTALRLGLDFDTVALLLSSKAISDVLDTYRKNSLRRNTTFEREVKAAIRELEKDQNIGENSEIAQQDITKKEMVWAITGKVREGRQSKANQINYKILNAVLGLLEASRTAQPLTDLSRLNSISSAPGPLHINTLTSDRKIGEGVDMSGIVKFKQSYRDKEGHVIEVGQSKGTGTIINGEHVTTANLNEFLERGDIEEFTGFDTVNRDTVFDDLPSLRAFYKSYEIAKQLFKDLGFTTASDAFGTVLNVLNPDYQFKLYSKDKLLSSLADFFQSYLLVQSGVIKASELKRYTTEFVEDFIKGDYKQQYLNNPFIQAIQPKLLSKKGEPDRYALSIDITGMEQSEKDVLSAGWAQLEKENPELSHKLFAYSFFRGGIGFNPKSFMSLVPIQVKENVQGYIETFEHIANMNEGTAKSVVDQWVRNNWGNKDLVTRVDGISPAAIKDGKLVFTGKETAKVYASPYIRVVMENGDLLFKRTTPTHNNEKVEYAMVEPLGNNGEYLEMYPVQSDSKALNVPEKAALETEESQIAETTTEGQEGPASVQEQARELNEFYDAAYAEEGKESAEQASLDKAFDDANRNLDIQTNKDKFDDIENSFCSNKK